MLHAVRVGESHKTHQTLDKQFWSLDPEGSLRGKTQTTTAVLRLLLPVAFLAPPLLDCTTTTTTTTATTNIISILTTTYYSFYYRCRYYYRDLPYQFILVASRAIIARPAPWPRPNRRRCRRDSRSRLRKAACVTQRVDAQGYRTMHAHAVMSEYAVYTFQSGQTHCTT